MCVCHRQFLVYLKGFAPEESEDNVISTSDTLIHLPSFFKRFKKRGRKMLSEDKNRINDQSHSNDDFVSERPGIFFSWYAGIIYTLFLTVS